MTRTGRVLLLLVSSAAFTARAQEGMGMAGEWAHQAPHMPEEGGLLVGRSEFGAHLYGRDPDDQDADTLYDAFGGCNGVCDGCGAADCLPVKTMQILPTCVPPHCDGDIFTLATVTVHTAKSGAASGAKPGVEVVGERRLKVSGVSHFIVVQLPSGRPQKRNSSFTTVAIEKPEDWIVDAKKGTVTLVFLPAYKLVKRMWAPIDPKENRKPPRHLRLVKLAPSKIEWRPQ
jgi:hypothetical protein